MKAEITVFVGERWLASGTLAEVLEAARPYADNSQGTVLAFENITGRQIDLDWHEHPAGPGRPKLGVTSAEVTLLPRHWEWLAAQPGRASATLRKLVEQAMRAEALDPRSRRDALLRLLWSLAGNQPQFEEVSRALTRNEPERVGELIADWPRDLVRLVETWE